METFFASYFLQVLRTHPEMLSAMTILVLLYLVFQVKDIKKEIKNSVRRSECAVHREYIEKQLNDLKRTKGV